MSASPNVEVDLDPSLARSNSDLKAGLDAYPSALSDSASSTQFNREHLTIDTDFERDSNASTISSLSSSQYNPTTLHPLTKARLIQQQSRHPEHGRYYAFHTPPSSTKSYGGLTPLSSTSRSVAAVDISQLHHNHQSSPPPSPMDQRTYAYSGDTSDDDGEIDDVADSKHLAYRRPSASFEGDDSDSSIPLNRHSCGLELGIKYNLGLGFTLDQPHSREARLSRTSFNVHSRCAPCEAGATYFPPFIPDENNDEDDEAFLASPLEPLRTALPQF